jgi:hypothetical protein
MARCGGELYVELVDAASGARITQPLGMVVALSVIDGEVYDDTPGQGSTVELLTTDSVSGVAGGGTGGGAGAWCRSLHRPPAGAGHCMGCACLGPRGANGLLVDTGTPACHPQGRMLLGASESMERDAQGRVLFALEVGRLGMSNGRGPAAAQQQQPAAQLAPSCR